MSLDLVSQTLPAEKMDSSKASGEWVSERHNASDSRQRSQPDRRSAVSRGLAHSWWMIARVVTAPFRAYLSLRRSVTVASISILLAAFMTLNVVWGFPWSGMMGGCLAMLFVGWAINRIMGPKLKLSVSLPRSAVAGHPFSVNVRLANARYLPALDLRLGWHREGVRDIYRQSDQQVWDASPPVNVDILRSGDQMQWHGSMRFEKRGIHSLPQFQVASTFPFHFFHNRRPIDTDTKIAITPAPARGEDDPTTRLMLASLGEWAKQLVKGAPVEYVGNREYQVGVPVRRWDFASWARLGRPIVREYQSPSIQAVTLIVDTSQPAVSDKSLSKSLLIERQREAAENFERLMSIAATAITEISSRRVQLKLIITSESDSELSKGQAGNLSDQDNGRMLVRLAAAEPIDPSLGAKRIREALQSIRSQPTLVFSLCDLDNGEHADLATDWPANATYFPFTPRRHPQWQRDTGAVS